MENAAAVLLMRVSCVILLLISVIVLGTSGSKYSIALTSSGYYADYTYVQSDTYSFTFSDALRYVMSGSVIGLAYSLLQTVLSLISMPKRNVIPPLFDYIGDMIILVVLLSSGSVGAGFVILLYKISTETAGRDKLLKYAAASVSMQFLAFVLVMICSVISARRTFSSLVSRDHANYNKDKPNNHAYNVAVGPPA